MCSPNATLAVIMYQAGCEVRVYFTTVITRLKISWHYSIIGQGNLTGVKEKGNAWLCTTFVDDQQFFLMAYVCWDPVDTCLCSIVTLGSAYPLINSHM